MISLASSHSKVDVLIPVYGQFDLAVTAISSVLEATQRTEFEVHVIDDGSEDPGLRSILSERQLLEHVSFHQHADNLGYTATCNMGMSLNLDRDVVLLNSDVVVFGNWIDRLRAIAYSSKRIGTVTPLTDYAGISSYPRWLQSNEALLDVSWMDLDALCASSNPSTWISAPTGIGFCMYIRRDCLLDVGLFDEQNFADGYGEENDFCQRAAQRDWLSVLALNTFVAHKGGCSFGERKDSLLPRAVDRVSRIHTSYMDDVQEFIRLDPLRQYRENLDLSRLRRANRGDGRLILVPRGRKVRPALLRNGRRETLSEGSAVLVGEVSRAGQVHLNYPQREAQFPNLPSLSLTGPPKRLSSALQALGIAQLSAHVCFAVQRKSLRYLREECREAHVSISWWW